MRIIAGVFFISLMHFSSVTVANDYPTDERVLYVLNCLQELDRYSLDDLQTCACRIDSIASDISFEDYNYAVAYDRNRKMGGKKGGIFRNNKAGKEFSKALMAAREVADRQCKKVVHIVAPSDLTGDKRYKDIKEIKQH